MKNKLEISKEIRRNIVKMVYTAKSGHPGGSLSAVEILVSLYFGEMNIDPAEPDKEERDHFVLSKGHITPAYYSVLAERGYFPKEELSTFRQMDSRLQGHPCMQHCPGIDMTTGSLGQGVSCAVGMALSAKLRDRNYRVYTLLGDGELEEGQVWEACMFAGHRKLDNLTIIIDNNNLQIDGPIDQVSSPDPIDEKLAAFGFSVTHVDGHNLEELEATYKKARETKGKPSAIIAHTVKGKGVSFMENQAGWHGQAPGKEQYEQAMAELGGEVK